MATPAHVLCSARGHRIGECRIEHVTTIHNLPPEPENGWPSVRGLNTLQASREEWLNGDAIENALTQHWESLPLQTQALIHLQDTSIEGLFLHSSARYDHFMTGTNRRFYARLREKEYTLWPCNYDGNHWVLTVIHKGRSRADVGGFDQVLQVAILDSWREVGSRSRKQRISTRLHGIFKKAGLQVGNESERIVWVPWQQDQWSCGLRTFWAGKQMMDRIQETVERSSGYDEQIWAPLPGWFNTDKVRWDMIGLNAYHAVKEMGYRARISVELVNSTLDDTGYSVDARQPMQPPARKGTFEKIEKPPGRRERTVVPIPLPNERRVAPSGTIPGPSRRQSTPKRTTDTSSSTSPSTGKNKSKNPAWARDVEPVTTREGTSATETATEPPRKRKRRKGDTSPSPRPPRKRH
ncbi:hypothetical protein F5B19DRAFT_277847 [Rostrohypoxylon terebratum]|nr:hypothetical protein F5B19DRAFT_277847 [Rostrohypoxylon terebratum]